MFGKEADQKNSNTTETLIGKGTIVEGKISSDAGLFIEGKVIGEIECNGDITVGKSGVMQCNTVARDIIVAGLVEGDIQAKGKLVIRSTGKLHGNISANLLIVNEGGHFQGISIMENTPQIPDKSDVRIGNQDEVDKEKQLKQKEKTKTAV